MSSKVDNIDIPEASPDANDEKQTEAKEAPRSRRNLWIGIFALLAVVLTVAIAVPLSLKKDDNKDNEADKAVSPESEVATMGLGDGGTPQCFEPTEGDDCTTQESYQQCLDLANAGCQMIISTFSCPPMHACGDESPEQLPAIEQCPAPAEGSDCITEESHQECMDLANGGCQKIYSTFSCPPQHRCGDETAEQLPAVSEQCPAPAEGRDCITEESHQECMDLVNGGCQKIYSTFSCPPQHRCGDESAQQLPEPPLAACTMELAYCADGTAVGRTGPDCHFEPCPDQGCPTGTYTCVDGFELSRDPALQCEFGRCPGRCTRELAPCSDGSPVGRSGPQCHFEECSDGACPIDTYTCDDGTVFQRDMALGCEFPVCEGTAVQLPAEGAVICTMDVQECPDGSFVGRNGPDCSFEPCPSVTEEARTNESEGPALSACTMEMHWCEDGTPVSRSGPKCEIETCPNGACPVGTYLCDDGTELERDPALGCEFPACQAPAVWACTLELKPCPDGSSVGRTGPNCEFAECPP